jgi:hypothetical protein
MEDSIPIAAILGDTYRVPLSPLSGTSPPWPIGVDECFALLTGQSVPILGVVVLDASMPIVMFLTTSDPTRPDRNSGISRARCRASHHGSNDPLPHSATPLPSQPLGTPAVLSGATRGRQI